MELMALIFPLSLPPSLSHTLLSFFVVLCVSLSLSLSVSQLEPTRAAPVTSPLTGKGAWGRRSFAYSGHAPAPTRVTPFSTPSLVLRSWSVRKLGKEKAPSNFLRFAQPSAKTVIKLISGVYRVTMLNPLFSDDISIFFCLIDLEGNKRSN